MVQKKFDVRQCLFVVALFLGLLTLGCSDPKGEESSSSPEKPKEREDLGSLMGRLQGAVLDGDDELAISLAKRLFPTQQTLALACSSSTHPAEYQQVSEWIEAVKPRDPTHYLKIYSFKSWQTEIIIASMTGEELAQIEAPEAKSKGFHPGAFKLARSGFLRPETEFSSVEFRKPGDQVGRRFEVFIWEAQTKSWKMLGPVWRAVREKTDQ